MILGETAAKRLFGSDADAVGRYVTIQSTLIARDGSQSAPPQVQIIGVAGDLRFGSTAARLSPSFSNLLGRPATSNIVIIRL